MCVGCGGGGMDGLVHRQRKNALERSLPKTRLRHTPKTNKKSMRRGRAPVDRCKRAGGGEMRDSGGGEMRDSGARNKNSASYLDKKVLWRSLPPKTATATATPQRPK